MTFTKTSQKFGQWADSRANTVYGLGFSTEQQLQQFSEQFKEVKEAARLAREKSQERFELANPALNIAAPQLAQELSEERHSPPLLTVNGPGEDKLIRSKSAEVELTSEKERIKKMLSEGSVCEVNLEAELFTLQDSNAKLVAALQEANSSVEQWKNQLAEYQQETDRLRDQVAELEAQSGRPAAGEPGADELSQSLEELEVLLKAKDQEIHNLQSKKSDVSELEKEREEAGQRLQELERRNAELEDQVQSTEKTLASSREEREQAEVEVRRVIEVLDVKICDLSDLRQSLAKLVDK
ncbi:homer protein homolog 3b [Diretmus argenteus]